MKEIVDKILKEEEQTRAQTEKAQADAAERITRAKKEAVSVIENTVSETRLEAERKRQESLQALQKEREDVLGETRRQAAQLREKRSKDIPQIAQQIFGQIIDIKI